MTSRIPVKIGLGSSILSFILVAVSLICFAFTPDYLYPGAGNFFWLLSLIPALISEMCYLSDLFRAIEDAKKKKHKLMNTVLALALIVSIPLALVVGTYIFWVPFHVLLFTLELISIKKGKS